MGVTADVRIPMRPLTVEDYERMVDVGILHEDEHVELLNGQLCEMSPQGERHAGMLEWLATVLIRGIAPEVAGVRVQSPLTFRPLSMPEPDIAIVEPGVKTRAHPLVAALVIEIAVTSRRFNLGAKAEIYAAAGVGEYWVIDIPARVVHVHRSPSAAGYGSCRQVASGTLRPPVQGGPEIDVETLFALLD
jgi:Uma2 family endonuclease